MEHREPPRIAGGEQRFEGALDDKGVRFQFRRFPFTRGSRQVNYNRALVVILVALGVLLSTGYLALQAKRAALDWLHHQSQYQVAFQEIILIPEPPPWFSGGRAVFLAAVRQAAREPESISLFDVPPDQLFQDFKSYSWVRDVEQVFYGPQQITIRLRYR